MTHQEPYDTDVNGFPTSSGDLLLLRFSQSLVDMLQAIEWDFIELENYECAPDLSDEHQARYARLQEIKQDVTNVKQVCYGFPTGSGDPTLLRFIQSLVNEFRVIQEDLYAVEADVYNPLLHKIKQDVTNVQQVSYSAAKFIQMNHEQNFLDIQ